MAWAKKGRYYGRYTDVTGRRVIFSTKYTIDLRGKENLRLAEARESMIQTMAGRKQWSVIAGVLAGKYTWAQLEVAYGASDLTALDTINNTPENPNVIPWLELYLEWVKKEYAAATLEHYEYTLWDFFGERYESKLSEFTPAKVMKWLDAKRHIGPTSRACYVRVLKVFSAWLRKTKRVSVDPLAELERPAAGPPRERHLEEVEVKRLVLATPPQYQLGVLLAHVAGLEAGVLIKLRKSDIDADGVVHAAGTKFKKGSAVNYRDRPTIILDWAWPLVQALLKPLGKLDPILPPRTSVQRISDVHRESAARAGLDDLHLHDGRHSFAVSLLKDPTIPEKDISNMMGHANVNMLRMVYGKYRTSAKDLVRLVRKRPVPKAATG